MILLKRIYDPEGKEAGPRFLIDRLWPRGIKKSSLQFDAWLKDVAPSTELRTWYHGNPGKWDEFKKRYHSELDARPESWQPLLEAARKGTITLLYSSREEKHNNAAALKEYLGKRIRRRIKQPNPASEPANRARQKRGTARKQANPKSP